MRFPGISHRRFIHTDSCCAIIPVIALAGTWCAPGIREGGGDLPPWKRFHGPEGARQAGMPGGKDRQSDPCCGGGRRSTVRPRRKWPCGRVPGRMWRQTPDGRALEAFVPSTNSCALQLPARLPTFQQRPDAKAGVATATHAASPTGRRPVRPPPRRASRQRRRYGP